MVIAAVVGGRELALGVDGASELPGEDDQRVVQHAALLEILNQRPDRLIHFFTLRRQHFGKIAVDVPAAMINLHEAHAPFGQPPRHHAGIREGAGFVFGIRPVHFPGGGRFLRKIRQFRHGGLHPERHLILRDTRLRLRIAQLVVRHLIEPGKPVEHGAANLRGDAIGIVDEQYRVARTAQAHAGVLAGEEPGAPEARGDRLHVRFRMIMLCLQHHERGQVFIHAAEPVAQPGTDAGSPRDHKSGLHERDGRFMVDRFGMHGADDRDIVHHARRVRQQFGDPRAGFAVLREIEDRGRDREAGLPAGHGGEALALPDGIGQVLIEHVLHLRLVVEGFHLWRRAYQMQVNAALRFWGEVRQTREGGGLGLVAQQGCQSQRADPLGAPCEEPAPRLPLRHGTRDAVNRVRAGRERRTRAPVEFECQRAVVAFLIRLQRIHLFSTSSRFRNSLVSMVSAAYSDCFSAGSGRCSPWFRNLRASSSCAA